jgi:hypothetical protein
MGVSGPRVAQAKGHPVVLTKGLQEESVAGQWATTHHQ